MLVCWWPTRRAWMKELQRCRWWWIFFQSSCAGVVEDWFFETQQTRYTFPPHPEANPIWQNAMTTGNCSFADVPWHISERWVEVCFNESVYWIFTFDRPLHEFFRTPFKHFLGHTSLLLEGDPGRRKSMCHRTCRVPPYMMCFFWFWPRFTTSMSNFIGMKWTMSLLFRCTWWFDSCFVILIENNTTPCSHISGSDSRRQIQKPSPCDGWSAESKM